jgi:hypothetical protein
MDLETCSVCYCDFDVIDNSYKTACNHQFHKECIKTWYKSNHPSCRFCPICRSLLNGEEIEPFESNYVPTYEEFIKLDGVVVYGSYLLIKMNSPNWIPLLKNLLVLITISHFQELIGTINRTKLIIKGTYRDMTFGFILEDVSFVVQKINQYNDSNSRKIMLQEIGETQFKNLEYLDKILLEITNNSSVEYSFIRKKYMNEEDNLDQMTHADAKLIANVYPFARQYDIEHRTSCNYENYTHGKCCVALISEVIHINDNIHYSLKCIDFAVISGYKL